MLNLIYSLRRTISLDAFAIVESDISSPSRSMTEGDKDPKK